MDSEFQRQQFHHHFQNPQIKFPHQIQQTNNLTRFNSAPCSFFSSFFPQPNNPSTNENENKYDLTDIKPLSPETERIVANFMSTFNDESTNTPEIKLEEQSIDQSQNTEYSNPTQKFVYRSQSKPPLGKPKQSHSVFEANAFVGGNEVKSDIKSSGLSRHCSSPAGFFDEISNIQNYNKGLVNPVSINSGTQRFDNTSYDSGIKLENQTGDDDMNHSKLLSHHLSLPKASLEKLLKMQDIVPCKIRAKRGFATHPRSIAERVRRTKISERMRKLQALVPNMDKQTNTSEMLDLAVEYIKDLQHQIKNLTDNQDKCTRCCSYRS